MGEKMDSKETIPHLLLRLTDNLLKITAVVENILDSTDCGSRTDHLAVMDVKSDLKKLKKQIVRES